MVFSILFRLLFFFPGFSIPAESNSTIPLPESIQVTRTFQRVPDKNDYTVTVSIQSSGITGFARYTDFLPPDAQVTILQSAGSEARTIDGKVKFVWTSMPTDPEIKVIYTIAFADSKLIMHYRGEFRYLSDNVVRNYDLTPSDLKLIGE